MRIFDAGKTKTGRTIYGQQMSEGEYALGTEEYCGACVFCGEVTEGDCGPDARQYSCDYCNEPGVYGLEALLMRGLVRLDGGDS